MYLEREGMRDGGIIVKVVICEAEVDNGDDGIWGPALPLERVSEVMMIIGNDEKAHVSCAFPSRK